MFFSFLYLLLYDSSAIQPEAFNALGKARTVRMKRERKNQWLAFESQDRTSNLH